MMAKNFYVEVWEGIDYADVVVKTMLEATGLASTNLSKQRTVRLLRTDSEVTHRTTAAAQAYIDVELFVLTAVNAET
jgi:hypothetical protein